MPRPRHRRLHLHAGAGSRGRFDPEYGIRAPLTDDNPVLAAALDDFRAGPNELLDDVHTPTAKAGLP